MSFWVTGMNQPNLLNLDGLPVAYRAASVAEGLEVCFDARHLARVGHADQKRSAFGVHESCDRLVHHQPEYEIALVRMDIDSCGLLELDELGLAPGDELLRAVDCWGLEPGHSPRPPS